MRETDLPRNRRALMLIDFINPLDFPRAQGLAVPALEAARSASQLARTARKHGVPVIYVNDNFGRWRSDFTSMVTRLRQGSGPSASIARLLRPRQNDLTVLKPMHSAFCGTPLDVILDKIGVRSLVMAGLATDICIQLSAADAFLRDLRVHAPEDCTAAETSEQKEAALAYMRDILKCDTRPWKSLPWRRSHSPLARAIRTRYCGSVILRGAAGRGTGARECDLLGFLSVIRCRESNGVSQGRP